MAPIEKERIRPEKGSHAEVAPASDKQTFIIHPDVHQPGRRDNLALLRVPDAFFSQIKDHTPHDVWGLNLPIQIPDVGGCGEKCNAQILITLTYDEEGRPSQASRSAAALHHDMAEQAGSMEPQLIFSESPEKDGYDEAYTEINRKFPNSSEVRYYIKKTDSGDVYEFAEGHMAFPRQEAQVFFPHPTYKNLQIRYRFDRSSWVHRSENKDEIFQLVNSFFDGEIAQN